MNLLTPFKLNLNGDIIVEEKNNIVIYQTVNGMTKINVKLAHESVWLSQQQMANLYDTTKQNISLHIKTLMMAADTQHLN